MSSSKAKKAEENTEQDKGPAIELPAGAEFPFQHIAFGDPSKPRMVGVMRVPPKKGDAGVSIHAFIIVVWLGKEQHTFVVNIVIAP